MTYRQLYELKVFVDAEIRRAESPAPKNSLERAMALHHSENGKESRRRFDV